MIEKKMLNALRQILKLLFGKAILTCSSSFNRSLISSSCTELSAILLSFYQNTFHLTYITYLSFFFAPLTNSFVSGGKMADNVHWKLFFLTVVIGVRFFLFSIMRSSRALQESSRQIYRILTAQRYRYHDLSRASVIGTPAQNSPEFQVRV